MKPRWTKWLLPTIPGYAVLQLSACVGDVQYFLVNSVANLLTANIVGTLYNLVINGLTTTTASLVG